MLVFDLDHFKNVNDTHGHLVGDKVLAAMGEIVRKSVRAEDVACRLGGEEFAIVMRATGWAGALQMAERLRSAVEKHAFKADGVELSVTISVGTATLDPARHDEPGTLLEEADQALYRAKDEGRNRVVGGACPNHESPDDSAPPADMKKTLT